MDDQQARVNEAAQRLAGEAGGGNGEELGNIVRESVQRSQGEV